MAKIFENIDCLVTMATNGKPAKTGVEMQEIGLIEKGAVIFDEKIIWTGKSGDAGKFITENGINIEERVNCSGKTVLPGFVDPHTHNVFAGNRSDEFARRLRGVSYVEIAKEGGGILKTVKATREATIEELTEKALFLMNKAIQYGTTSFEVKSGYSLTTNGELKQLRAIKKAAEQLPVTIVPTFLGAHDFPPEYQNNRDYYVDMVCNEMIPLVAEEGLAEFCDAFVDEGYYTVAQGEKIFRTALDYGMKLKVHADELACVNAAELAGKMNAVSADHLLFISDDGIESLKNGGTVATLLPGTSYFIRMPYANARKIIDAGVTTALATDTNPGSSYTVNMQNILSLAVINLRMTAEEALAAATINAAHAIRRSDTIGSIEKGKYADMQILDYPSYTDIFYFFGINHTESVWIHGNKLF